VAYSRTQVPPHLCGAWMCRGRRAWWMCWGNYTDFFKLTSTSQVEQHATACAYNNGRKSVANCVNGGAPGAVQSSGMAHHPRNEGFVCWYKKLEAARCCASPAKHAVLVRLDDSTTTYSPKLYKNVQGLPMNTTIR
jgi:hypothetical protein